MSEKLILRLSSQSSSSVPWLVWSESTNEVIVSGELSSQAELANLASYAHGRPVTVLVNSADVRLYRHYMVTKPTRQLLNALPFALEDELAEDIDKLHFSIERTGFDKIRNAYFVNLAIVRKSLIFHWLSLLQEAGLNAKIMLPDLLCVPYLAREDSRVISAMELAGSWLIREGDWSGACIDKSWLNLYCQQKLTAKDDRDETSGSLIHFQHYSELPDELVSNLITNPALSFDAQQPELPMLILAQQAKSLDWNLLQGELAPKKPVSKSWQIWRPAAGLLVGVLLIKITLALFSWQQSNQQLDLAQQELKDIYQAAFPKEKLRVGLVRRQLTRKVAEATGGAISSESGFLELMNKMTPTFQKFTEVKPDSFRYDGKRAEIRLNASAPSFQKFEQFKNSLQELGLEVTQGAVNNEGQTVTGSLNIKEAS